MQLNMPNIHSQCSFTGDTGCLDVLCEPLKTVTWVPDTLRLTVREYISHYITVLLHPSWNVWFEREYTYVTLTLFIPSQHPDFDVSFGQLLYGLWHAVLQLVLHGCRSQQLKTTEYRVVTWKGIIRWWIKSIFSVWCVIEQYIQYIKFFVR